MEKSENQYIEDPAAAEVGRLVDHGFTYAQAMERVYGPNTQEPKKIDELGSSSPKRSKHTISRNNLSSGEKLDADDTPDSVTQKAIARASIEAAMQLPIDLSEQRRAREEILDRLRGSGPDQTAA